MLWTNILVMLCVTLEVTSGYYYYRRNHRHRHRHVYNCRYSQGCVRRRGPPSCNQWCLVYYMVGNCQQARYECCSYKEKSGYCPQDPAVCALPYSYYATKAYECQHDFRCPTGYKCCKDSCFVHKVCKPLQPCSNIPPHPTKTTAIYTRETEEMSTKVPKTTTIKYITTTKILTTKREETTTPVETTFPPETTEKITTISPDFQTTTAVPTTQKEITTIKLTTPPGLVQTTIDVSTTQRETTTDLIVAPPKATTIDDIEGSADGSGDFEVPEPEAARLIQNNLFVDISDDEDFVRNVMDYEIIRA